MLTLTPENLKAIEQLTPLMILHNIPTNVFNSIDRENEYPMANYFAKDVLSLCGLTDEQLNLVVDGINYKNVKADLENFSGWSESYSWYVLKYALDTYTDIMINHDMRISVGMKYPSFNPKQFIKKYNLTFIASLQSAYGIEMSKKYPESSVQSYDVYTDPKGNVYSFQPNAIGLGGYSGFVFNDIETAFKFVKDFLNSKSRYVKDINMINNGLGGFDKNDIDYYRKAFN